MGSTDIFNLSSAILEWQETNLKDIGITDGDKTEITDHLRDTIGKLQKMGLSDEEAFVVAKMRLGHVDNWGQELKEVSDDNFQIKKVVNIFFGILIYFTIHFAIIASIFTTFIVLENLKINTVEENINILDTLWKAAYIITFLVILSCFIYRNKLIPWLKKMKLGAMNMTITFVLFIVSLFGERIARYHIGDDMLVQYENWSRLRSSIIMPKSNFEYFFPMLVCFSFLIIFFLYRRKNYL